jgi:hypothetical protein
MILYSNLLNLEGAEMKVLRKIIGKTRRDRISNENIR